MKEFRIKLRTITAMAGVIATPCATFATVTGSVTDNGNGTFTYQYSVTNPSTTQSVIDFALQFEFSSPDWNRLDTFNGGDVTVPDGWFASAAPAAIGSAQDFLSISADVLPNGSLSGFSFVSSFGPGTITYQEFFDGGQEAIPGETLGPVAHTVSVPDAGSSLFVTTAAALCAIAQMRRKTSRA